MLGTFESNYLLSRMAFFSKNTRFLLWMYVIVGNFLCLNSAIAQPTSESTSARQTSLNTTPKPRRIRPETTLHGPWKRLHAILAQDQNAQWPARLDFSTLDGSQTALLFVAPQNKLPITSLRRLLRRGARIAIFTGDDPTIVAPLIDNYDITFHTAAHFPEANPLFVEDSPRITLAPRSFAHPISKDVPAVLRAEKTLLTHPTLLPLFRLNAESNDAGWAFVGNIETGHLFVAADATPLQDALLHAQPNRNLLVNTAHFLSGDDRRPIQVIMPRTILVGGGDIMASVGRMDDELKKVDVALAGRFSKRWGLFLAGVVLGLLLLMLWKGRSRSSAARWQPRLRHENYPKAVEIRKKIEDSLHRKNSRHDGVAMSEEVRIRTLAEVSEKVRFEYPHPVTDDDLQVLEHYLRRLALAHG